MLHYLYIIKGVQKKEKKSQMAFYDLFYKPVYQSAYAITGNRDEAEEIMHDTLLKVYSNTGLLHDDIGSMTRRLRRIAVNQAIDLLRKRKEWMVSLEDDMESDIEDETDENGEEYNLSVDDIKVGISRLSNAYKHIITLRLFEEMSFADIAGQLKINASTARVQYQRGILKLRKLLKHQIYAYD
ncbi:MAG: sigma-70 family RNA polymerase sigma factor [Tannerella sp.]|jgi:RNA polymerase sigma-70 factor (ECF subfamily)|nr:sigma-70 family RNA polymerase sigma factor [Tannerella sp.]